jgi:hypothetical protein
MSSTKTDVQVRLLDRLTVLTTDIKNQHFAVGDLLLEMEAQEDWYTYLEDAAQTSGYDPDTLADWGTVAKRIPQPLRNGFPSVTWSHWVAVSRLKEWYTDKYGDVCRKPASVEAMQKLVEKITPETTVVELRQTVAMMSGGPQEFKITLDSRSVDFLVVTKRVENVKGIREFVQSMVTRQIIDWLNGVEDNWQTYLREKALEGLPNIFDLLAEFPEVEPVMEPTSEFDAVAFEAEITGVEVPELEPVPVELPLEGGNHGFESFDELEPTY